ncbi:hypothetical protein [Sphingomonas sp. 28-62-20]|uniref:hypothetical protein n=1 Tax=Sphingomonas sp. 28-62-20 TaxID=1970433 RepID=UPI0035A86987
MVTNLQQSDDTRVDVGVPEDFSFISRQRWVDREIANPSVPPPDRRERATV